MTKSKNGAPRLVPANGSQLRVARATAAERFARLGRQLLATIGLTTPTKIRASLSGRAGFRRNGAIKLECPWPTTTRRRLYVCAHEVGHIVLEHVKAGRRRLNRPVHVIEVEAEQWAHSWLRAHGVAVPRKDTRRAKRYVAFKIKRAIRNGAKAIDRRAARFARLNLNSSGSTAHDGERHRRPSEIVLTNRREPRR